MESIKELRQICQLPREKYDSWYGANICRRISIYITRAIIPLGISANLVTFICMIAGILACLFFAIGKTFWFGIGVATLHIWYILDHVDGEVARYRKSSNITGIYFDKVIHYIVHPSCYFCLGWGAYRDLGFTQTIAAGYIAGISMLLITATADLKDSTILQKLMFNKKDVSFKGRDERGNLLEPKEKNTIKQLFSRMHNICTFPNDMNLLTVVIILKFLLFNMATYFFLLFFAVFATLTWISRLTFFIVTKKLDFEVERLYK